MSNPSWDPDAYLQFADERARPFCDLVARVGLKAPRAVVDLGSGPGTMTATLCDRWPAARVVGVDASPEMVAAARRLTRPGRLTFELADLRNYRPPAPVDLLVSNAALQWVPGHEALFEGWLRDCLEEGGVLAFQVPASRGAAAGAVFRAVATSERWSARLGTIAAGTGPRAAGSPVREPGEYVDALASLGCEVDAWETTYFHVLRGDDPVLAWFSGTGLRPYLDALAGDAEATLAFRADIARALREPYPPKPFGTVLPFRRIFVVARKRR